MLRSEGVTPAAVNRAEGGARRLDGTHFPIGYSINRLINTEGEPIGALVGRPDRRHELLLPGGHVTFGTGRSAFRHSLPALAAWIATHSDERNPERKP